MRPRRSLTGPLILILIGAFFLIDNLRPGFAPWSFFRDYWPFLLIGAGVIGLIEVLIAVGQGVETPPRPLGGGWVFWLALWVVIGGIISDHGGLVISDRGVRIRPFTLDGASVLGTGYDYDLPVLDQQTSGASRLVLENLRGDVAVKGADIATIHVSGKKTVRGFSRTEADRADHESAISMERRGDALVLKVASPGNSGDLSVSTDLDISLPKSLALELHSRAGDLTVENLDGNVDLTGTRGDVRVSNVGGTVRVESARSGLVRAADVKRDVDIEGRGGDVQLENVTGESRVHGEFSGTLEFRRLAKSVRFESERSQFYVEAIPGEVKIDPGDVKLSNVTGPVHYSTGSRDIDSRDITGSLDLQIQRGDIRVTQSTTPLPKIDVHTHSGDIQLSLPDKAAFQLNASTSRGEADNSFGAPLETRTANQRASIVGQTGPGPVITAATDRGSIAVRKF